MVLGAGTGVSIRGADQMKRRYLILGLLVVAAMGAAHALALDGRAKLHEAKEQSGKTVAA
jgi:hypothetical protein